MLLLSMRRTLLITFAFAVVAFYGAVTLHAGPKWDLFKPKKPTPATEILMAQEVPKVTPRVLEKATPENTHIYISLDKQRAFLFVDDEMAIDTPVSTGKGKGMTPQGQFEILEKAEKHTSNIYGDFVDSGGQVVRGGVSTKVDSAPSGTRFRGAPMAWFLRLTWEGAGMHVGDLPGYPASDGCIRLPTDIARLFFQNTKIGTPVEIGN